MKLKRIKTTLNAFKSAIFPFEKAERKESKTSNTKQMFQRLAIVLAQVKAGNTSENYLN